MRRGNAAVEITNNCICDSSIVFNVHVLSSARNKISTVRLQSRSSEPGLRLSAAAVLRILISLLLRRRSRSSLISSFKALKIVRSHGTCSS